MATHDVNDLALAALVFQIGLLKVLAAKGILRNDEAKDVMNSAVASLGTNPRKDAVVAVLKDMVG